MCNRQNHGCIHEKLLMLSYMYVCTSLKADQGHIIFLENTAINMFTLFW